MVFPDLLKSWRQIGWQDASLEDYARAYERFGGSFATHPEVLRRLSNLLELDLTFLARVEAGEVIGALPLWGRYIAGTKSAMRGMGRRDWLDIGNPEIILPLSPGHQFTVRHKAKYLSARHEGQILNAKILPYSIGLAKSLAGGDFSGRFRYNQRRTKRLLEEAGGEVLSLAPLPSREIAEAYVRVFNLRWGWNPEGHERLESTLEALRPFLAGHMITLSGTPVALQLIYFAESPEWVSFEGINAPVDPAARSLSPGTVLTYVGLEAAEEFAAERGKTLRYSFGKLNDDYKLLWCKPAPVYQT